MAALTPHRSLHIMELLYLGYLEMTWLYVLWSRSATIHVYKDQQLQLQKIQPTSSLPIFHSYLDLLIHHADSCGSLHV